MTNRSRSGVVGCSGDLLAAGRIKNKNGFINFPEVYPAGADLDHVGESHDLTLELSHLQMLFMSRMV